MKEGSNKWRAVSGARGDTKERYKKVESKRGMARFLETEIYFNSQGHSKCSTRARSRK